MTINEMPDTNDPSDPLPSPDGEGTDLTTPQDETEPEHEPLDPFEQVDALLAPLPIGSVLTRVERGWKVVIPRGSNPAHGEGPTLVHAFRVMDARYETLRDGTTRMVDIEGNPIRVG